MTTQAPIHWQTSLKALADSVSLALKQNDIPRAMHLSWILMMQPQCPLQLQSHAVLVHSVASLTLGGDTEVVENNLQAMVKRLGGLRSKLLPMREEASWNVQALGQLRDVLNALHGSQKANMFRRHPNETRLRELDSLVEGIGKMDLGYTHGGTPWH